MDVRLLIASWPQHSPRGAVSKFCLDNAISRSQFYALRHRAPAAGEDLTTVLMPRSRAPGRHPNATSLEIEDLAIRVRKQLADDGWDHGPVTVSAHLHRLGITPPSTATLARIFRRRGLVVPAPNKRPRASWRRFTFPNPNACWQLDATSWHLLDGTEVAILQVLDDHSRRLLASLAASGETSDAALQVTQTALERFGIPQLVLTDNGAAFNPTRRGQRGQLEMALCALGVKPITTRPYHPQTNGKNERVHATLKRWLRARPRAASLTELQSQLDAFDEYYNQHRPHQALNGQTPVHTWDATPLATPPRPPEDPDTPAAAAPTMTVTQPLTNRQGKIWVANHSIHLGWDHIGTHVIAVRDGEHIDIFTTTGTHIRSLTLEPGRNHYASGRPRGPRNLPRSTNTTQSGIC